MSKNFGFLLLSSVLITTIFSACLFKKKQDNTTTTSNNSVPIVYTVEKSPSFPGGNQALFDFIHKTKKYPKDFGSLGIEGKVYVGFTVNKDGTLSNIHIAKSLHPSIDAEALKVVKAMPKWIPASSRNKPVAQNLQLPIDFYFLK